METPVSDFTKVHAPGSKVCLPRCRTVIIVVIVGYGVILAADKMTRKMSGKCLGLSWLAMPTQNALGVV